MTSLIQNKNGQYTITIHKEVIEAVGWKKGQKLYVGKEKSSNNLFIEEIPKKEVKNSLIWKK